ncbi:MAG: SsrA-binding protein SmpB [Patescibacteria group bacterium]|nr:SsrA-binding protein SmpB [Patescibacteria group bacterium]
MEMLIQNKKVFLNYEIIEKFVAGIELLGFEVKSLKNKLGSLEGSHITIRGGETYIISSHIPAYQPANTPKNYDPYRHRRLLLTKKEISVLSDIESSKGLTIVPISVYNAKGRIKIEIGVAKGKKKYDKRQDLKKKTVDREIRREFSDR